MSLRFYRQLVGSLFSLFLLQIINILRWGSSDLKLWLADIFFSTLKTTSVLFSAWKIPAGSCFEGVGGRGVKFQFSFFIEHLHDIFLELTLGTGLFFKVREI